MTEQPATPRQVAYAADLRDLLVEQPTRRAEEQIASVVRAIWQGIDQSEQALSAARCAASTATGRDPRDQSGQ